MGYVYQEYPKNLYRWGATGVRESKLFRTAEEVEPGWVSIDDLGEPPAAELPSQPMPGKEAASAAKRIITLEQENKRLLDTVKLYEDESAAKDREIGALREALEAAEAMLKEQGLEAPAVEPAPKTEKKKRTAKA